MNKELLPIGTRVKLPDGRIGIIDDTDAEVTEVFEDINYYICPIEFTNEDVWSNHYIMLRREEFSVEENSFEGLLTNYSILPASDAKNYTLRNRAKPIETTLSAIENKIIAAISKGDGAIYWQFEDENMTYMHEIINELYKCGYTVKDSNDYEDSSSISIIISWL